MALTAQDVADAFTNAGFDTPQKFAAVVDVLSAITNVYLADAQLAEAQSNRQTVEQQLTDSISSAQAGQVAAQQNLAEKGAALAALMTPSE